MAERRLTTREVLRSVDNSLHTRWDRVRKRLLFILQSTIGAGVAYVVADQVFGHHQPFFAPMTVVIILGLSGGDRLSRAFELSVGVIAGVAVGTTLVQLVGSGAWQIALFVAVGLLFASFASRSVLVANQVVIGCILIATILPPEGHGAYDRVIDAIVGMVIGLATIALIPSSALAAGRAEISKVLRLASSVLSDVSRGLRTDDPALIREARSAVRGSQQVINAMLSAAKSGKEASDISPWMRTQRRKVKSMQRILPQVDNCIRNVRVMARRAVVLAEDGDRVSERQIHMIDELSDIALELSQLFDAKAGKNQALEIPGLVTRLKTVGALATMDAVEDRNVLSAYSILAQTRSAVVDLLMVCGLSYESALASLAPTSEHPAYPSEVLPVDPHEFTRRQRQRQQRLEAVESESHDDI